jgi:predicted RecB family nuclease
MRPVEKKLMTCSNGHQYYKSSDCPVCPVCEKERKSKDGFLSVISAPARRALEGKGISTLKQLSKYSEAEILSLHGMGPGSIPKLNNELEMAGLSFQKNKNRSK